MKHGIILLLLLALLVQCSESKESVDVEKLKYKEQKDTRTGAEAPVKLKNGYNFSVYAPNAQHVFIVGDFNNWLDNRNPMEKNSSGVWSVTIPMKKGGYSYKFNLDGAWIIDRNNPDVVKDTLGDRRSYIEVKEDTPFYREPFYFGYTNASAPRITMSGVLFTFQDKSARKVSVAGTFNNWEKGDFPLEKNVNGVWHGYVQIPRGEYYYKFVADGLWKSDPANPEKVDDGYGDFKSILKIEKDIEDRPDKPMIVPYEIIRFSFHNKDLPSQYPISIIGSFNDWQSNVNVMQDDDFNKEWFVTVRLPEGEYYYKFLLAGKEFFDPENTARGLSPENKEANYLKVVLAKGQFNVKFTYYDPEARDIHLVGDFNNWDVEADKFQKDQYGLWYIVKKLARGKYLYQYVVDGKWILDINNPYTAIDMNNDLNSYLEIK